MSSNLEALQSAKRIVIKLGTQVVMHDKGHLALDRLFWVVNQCVDLMAAGKEILVVTSGAVGLGRQRLGMFGPVELPVKQACAAIGQSLLMDAYNELFAQHQKVTAQILVSATDFSDRQKYLNLRETLERLMAFGVIPIINENDTVSVVELEEHARTKSFGDNDKLSAIVASKLSADLLVLLTNVDGLYTDNPATNPDATIITKIEEFDTLTQINTEGQSAFGRGGMTSKLDASRIAALSGVYTLITSGFKPNPVGFLLDAEAKTWSGTLVVPTNQKLSDRRHWIGVASGAQGVLVINEGARSALVDRFASLLSVGIIGVQGHFHPKEVVSIHDDHGNELGRGIVNFSAEDVRRIMGHPSGEIPQILNHLHTVDDVVIQRDNLVIFEEYRIR